MTDSTIIEYTLEGAFQLNSISFGGHVDGLRVDPLTKLVWVTSNEDGGARLFRLDPSTGISREITIATLPQGGGLRTRFYTESAGRSRILGRKNVPMNLQDPDSLAITSDGQLVLSNQDGAQFVFIKNPGEASHSVRVLNVADKIDDSVWATSRHGQLLVADGNANVIYSIEKSGGFTPGEAFTQVDHHAVTAPLVGTLNLASGTFTAIATGPGLANPTGMLFLPNR